MTAEFSDRVDKAEELLCNGLGAGLVERQMAKEYSVTPRQARRYISAVYRRWEIQSTDDAPHRREKLIHMTERFYAKAMIAKDLKSAAQGLHILAKMSGGFTQFDPARAKRVKKLGVPPTDPTQILIYAQRCMVMTLAEVMSNPTLDPERRMRWVTELASKLGMTHAKALVEARLDTVEARAGVEDADASEEPE